LENGNFGDLSVDKCIVVILHKQDGVVWTELRVEFSFIVCATLLVKCLVREFK
jgi:hypothetical protein